MPTHYIDMHFFKNYYKYTEKINSDNIFFLKFSFYKNIS